jgi:glycosyltransferase involved in cell wall biosynthesis
MSKTNSRSKIRVVGAGNSGGVKTYVLNIASTDPNIIIYEYSKFRLFWRELSKGDSIFLNVIKPSILYLFMIYLRGRKHFRVVFCSHGLSYLRHTGVRRLIIKVLIRLVSSVSDGVVVLNQCDLNLFKRWNDSSYCIPTVLQPLTERKTFCSDFDSKSGLKWVMAGNLFEYKNPWEFVNIAKSILAEFPSDRFIWIGQGPLFSEMKELVQKIEGIDFIGERENKEVREYLYLSDICLCTSFFEVLPITLLEAADSNMIMILKKAHYSDDIAHRFKSCIVYQNLQEVIGFRSNTHLLKQKKDSATKIYMEKNSNYDLYVQQMNKVLYG